jgi:hypothetical protein
LPFLGDGDEVGCALAKALAFFWLFSVFCAASCFFCRVWDLGDLSPMGYRLWSECTTRNWLGVKVRVCGGCRLGGGC